MTAQKVGNLHLHIPKYIFCCFGFLLLSFLVLIDFGIYSISFEIISFKISYPSQLTLKVIVMTIDALGHF